MFESMDMRIQKSKDKSIRESVEKLQVLFFLFDAGFTVALQKAYLDFVEDSREFVI